MYQAYIRNLWCYLRQALVESDGRRMKTRPCIGIPISENKPLVTDKIGLPHTTDNENFCGVHWFDYIGDSSMLGKMVWR